MKAETYSCGCVIKGCGSGKSVRRIQFCKLHLAAPELVEACKFAIQELGPDPKLWRACHVLRGAVAKAS